jgi:thiamine-phosphate pyrophosphorylase
MTKKEILQKVQLYVITDRKLSLGRELEEVVSLAIEGGVGMIQLREKNITDKEFYQLGLKIKKVTQTKKIPLIINDRLDIALAVGAEGVHLGQEELPIKIARKILGKDKIIGVSAETVNQAILAEEEGADYIGFGPIFYTKTKKIEKVCGIGLLEEVQCEVSIPLFPIGGIDLENVSQITRLGIKRAAVISTVMSAKDTKTTCQKFLLKLKG